MQRSRAAKALRVLHRLEVEKTTTPTETGRLLEDENTLEDIVEHDGDASSTRKLKRTTSKEWAESLLQWDGSQQIGVVGTDVGIADFDPDMSRNSSKDSRARSMWANVEKAHELAVDSFRGAEDDYVKERHEDVGFFAPMSDLMEAKDMIFGNWINLMLIALPFAVISHFLGWNANIVFLLNLIAVVPLALILGEITEDLALRFGDVFGGLINATFGNVVEMILSIVLLKKGLTDVVSSTLIGSILSNLLLVIGCCFFVGGLYNKQQRFSSGASKANTSLLFMSCIAMILPSMISYSIDDKKEQEEKVTNISHCVAIVLTIIYICYLYFQLISHNDIFDSSSSSRRLDEDAEEEEQPVYSLTGAVFLMTLTTGIVAFCSEFLSDAIEEVSKDSGLSMSFIGIIVLPIAGNACEHITAVLVAAKNKMDLAIAVGVGSSIQIAIFVYPFIVLVAWAMKVDFTMKLNLFDMLVVTVSVLLCAVITIDGQSNWFTGLMLITTYILIGFAYFF